MTDDDTHPTHRVELTLGVHARDDDEAGAIAKAVYERFAQDLVSVDGVLWLLPVANIKPDPFKDIR